MKSLCVHSDVKWEVIVKTCSKPEETSILQSSRVTSVVFVFFIITKIFLK